MIHIIGLWLDIHSVTDLKLGVVSCKSVFISANLEKMNLLEQMIYFRMDSTSSRLN